MCRCPPSSETVNGGNGCSYMYASDFTTDWPNGQPEGSRISAFITARRVRALELCTTDENLAKGSNCASRTTLVSLNVHSSKPRLLWRVVDATCTCIALKFRGSTFSLTVESFAKKMDSGCQMHKQIMILGLNSIFSKCGMCQIFAQQVTYITTDMFISSWTIVLLSINATD